MGDSRTSNSLKNMFASVSYQLLNLILSFISRSVFIQVLGVEYLGISGLFSDVLSMLNMAELGFGTAMTYSMYKPLAEKDYDKLAGLTYFYKKIYRIIALTITIVGLALIPFLPYIVNLQKDMPYLELYYVLFLASHVASYLVVYKTTVLYADQKNHVLLKYSSYWSMAQNIVMLIALWLTKNYILYLILQVIFVYASNFHKSYIAGKYYPYLNKKVKLSKNETKGIFKDVGSAFIYKIANVFITATDNTLISILISTEMIGYYSNYRIIITKLGAIISTFFSSLIASLGNLLVKEGSEKRYEVFQTIQSLSLIISTFFVTCIFLLEEDFIRVWLGKEFILGPIVLVAVVTNFYFSIALMPITTFREAAGLFRKTKFIMLWTAIINILLSIFLGNIIGLSGILFATSISKLVTNFWYEPILLFRNYFKKSTYLYFLDMLKGIAITVLSIIIAWLTSSWLIPNSWLELIFKGCLIAISSIIVIIVCYYRTEGFKLLLNRVKTTFFTLIKNNSNKGRG